MDGMPTFLISENFMWWVIIIGIPFWLLMHIIPFCYRMWKKYRA